MSVVHINKRSKESLPFWCVAKCDNTYCVETCDGDVVTVYTQQRFVFRYLLWQSIRSAREVYFTLAGHDLVSNIMYMIVHDLGACEHCNGHRIVPTPSPEFSIIFIDVIGMKSGIPRVSVGRNELKSGVT